MCAVIFYRVISRHLYLTLPPGRRLYFSHAHDLGYPTISCTFVVSRNFGKAFLAHDALNTAWIINSGATDHMTYNSDLFSTILLPHRDHVLTANNATAPVTRTGSVLWTPILPLDKVLLDIQTQEIFGHGTKIVGLYYVDDMATSRFFHIQGVLHETTYPQALQHNEVAKCKSRHIIAAARALLLGVSIPKQF
ncbi:unnamed protein product [Prunus armeniaca]